MSNDLIPNDMQMISRYTIGGLIIATYLWTKNLFIWGIIVMFIGLVLHIITYKNKQAKKEAKKEESLKARQEACRIREENGVLGKIAKDFREKADKM
jgi:hypothetical protein